MNQKPTPLIMARIKPDAPAKPLSIIKAKHVKPGMTIQAYVIDEPRGSVRTVASVEAIGDNADIIRLTFSTPHPTQDYKPAYRFAEVSK